jgi:CheY-like chemotaxis protein
MSGTPSRPYILLVEDSEDDVFFFRHALKKTCVTCTLAHAADGAAAIEYLKRAMAGDPKSPWPDLVFLDLKLPTFSGFEVLGWIRENKIESRLDVAILSGSEHASDVERAMGLGATGYLVKPVSVEQLQMRVTRWSEAHAGSDPAKTAIAS